MTRYQKLLVVRSALVRARCDVGALLWQVDKIIQRERGSARYTGQVEVLRTVRAEQRGG
jgi:hypothetical protein